MSDIPLARAVLCWTTSRQGTPAFEVRMLGAPTQPHRMTSGAVYAEWKQGNTNDRLLMLFGEVMTIMVRDGVPFAMIHAELLRIPEYRSDVLANDVPGRGASS